MINTFLDSIDSYRKDLDTFTQEEYRELGNLSDRTILIREKIKIANMFSRYIIERCKPSEVNSLRRLVEDYEYRVEVCADDVEIGEGFPDLKNMTAFIDMLFGMDTPYYESVYNIVYNERLDDIISYVSNGEYNYETILSYIKGGKGKRL